ncbi:MAG: GEVED domain-containing protein [Bacteroidales bacterium]
MEGTFDFRVYAMDYATIIEEKMVSVTNNVFDFHLQESFAWSFETGVFEPQWIFGGNAPWFITTTNPYDGLYCSQSGAIGNNSTSEMEITLFLSSGGDISFFRKVSSEATYDFLEFYIDNVLQDEWSGELDWAEVSFPVAYGEHTFKWVYSKDQSVANGSDCGWIDYIIFPPIIPPPDPAEIALSPLSFEVTLAPDGSTVEQLNIGNTGEMVLGFELFKSYLTDGGGSKAYCSSVGGGGDEFIENVTIGTINNTSSQSYYADYTSLSTNVNIGESYSISITNGDPIWSSDQCGIWVDWNQNEDFTDDGTITVSGTPGVGPYTATIIPPINAMGGPTRMRVQIIYAATPNPCVASFSYGEVEDYTLVVNNNFVDWLTLNPITGSVAGSDNMDINVSFNATGMEIGDYFANVIINSNDPVYPQVIVPCTLHVVDQISVDLKAVLEGPFAGNEMQTTLNTSGMLPLNQPFSAVPWNYSGTESVAAIPNADVVDWVLVELRETPGDASTATPATTIGSQAGFILKDGSIVAIDGISLLRFDLVIAQNLFTVVYHRNHIGIMSASPLANAAGAYTLNFSSAAGQAHGGPSSQKEIAPGVWAMFAGDADGNGTVNMDDKLLEWQVQAGTKGFMGEDYNLDGQVDNQDKDDCWLINNGKTTYIPYE